MGNALNPADLTQGMSRGLVWVSALALIGVLGWNAWDAYVYHRQLHAVRCDQPVFDFNTALLEETIEHTFQVVNLGRQPLTIQKVMAACGCTTIAEELEGREITPQESFEVPVALTLQGVPTGDLVKRVVIEFAGKPHRKMTLTVKGNVKPRWNLSPTRLVFDGVPVDAESIRTITVTRSAMLEEGEIRFVGTPDFLQAQVAEPESTELGQMWRVTFTTVPPLKTGRQNGYITFDMTDSTGQPGPSVPVTVIAVPDGVPVAAE